MLLTLLFSVMAFANEPDFNDGFRVGVCLGNSPECLGTNIKLGYAGKFGGFNVGLPFIPLGSSFSASVSVRYYPKSVRENQKENWRPYVYGGGAIYYEDSPRRSLESVPEPTFTLHNPVDCVFNPRLGECLLMSLGPCPRRLCHSL